MKINRDSIPYVVVFSFLATVAFVVLLAIGNQLTLPRIQQNQRFAERSAVLRSFGIAFSGPTEADSKFESEVRKPSRSDASTLAYEATVEGTTWIAVRETGNGLWGSIVAIVAADATATRLRGVEVVSHNETPGLGGRIDEIWFKEQFRGRKVGADGKISIDQNGTGKGEGDKEKPRVDAITGASLTSGFLRDIVNAALSRIRTIGGGK